MGYESAYQVDAPGQFAVRGGIVDIFALTEELPYRIELWGDEIDSIRTFDPDSQRSVDTLDEIVVYPAAELVLTKAQQEAGLKQITAEGKRLSEQYRKEMKPRKRTDWNRQWNYCRSRWKNLEVYGRQKVI